MLQYDQEIMKLEEGKKTTYITSTERLRIEEGKKEIIQNLYSSLKDEREVAKLSKVSLKKVREILGKGKKT